MEGISKDRLLKLREHFNKDYSIVEAKVIQDLLNECQEPWMTLEEFLKSGFCGKCWIPVMGTVIQVEYDNSGFWNGIRYLNDIGVTKVMPIHKPEPPR